jgi:hypothetical protein
MSMKYSNVIFFSAGVLMLALLLFTIPEERRRSGADDEKGALVALMGGPGEKSMKTRDSGSLFDSQFWNTGAGNGALPDEQEPAASDEVPEILEKVSEGNPTNPQTGLAYTDDQMKQFETLREKFPGNSIIPRRVTPERQKQLEEERREIVEIQKRMTDRKASAQDVTSFYDFQMKGMKDRAELLQYVLEKMGADMDDDMKSKYRQVLESSQRQIRNLEEQKQKAIQNVD